MESLVGKKQQEQGKKGAPTPRQYHMSQHERIITKSHAMR